VAVWAWTLGTSELGSTTRLGSNEGAGTAALVLGGAGAGTTARAGSGTVGLGLGAVGAGQSPNGGFGGVALSLSAAGVGPGGLFPVNEALVAYLQHEWGVTSTDATVLVQRYLQAAGGDGTTAMRALITAAVAYARES
jgi:hypothetical protein